MNPSVPVTDRHTWSLFTDWCTALDQRALPAAPESLAQFLRAHPAAPTTQRRRIAVIDAAHHRLALPPPGRAETVRAALDVARTARLRELAALLGGIIERLPESGWPAVVFARRDALILALATTGLPYTQIAALRVCDVAADPGIDALRVETVNGIAVTSPELVRAGVSPKRVYRRWWEVLGHQRRYPSTRMLADAIESEGGSELAGYERCLDSADVQPLLTSIDRWGHAPLTAAPLTARAIAGIVRMHLDGRAAAHLQPRVRIQPAERGVAHELAVPVVVLDSDYYERGTRARRDAHELLGDVDSVLADVEAQAEKMLNDFLVFLESETDEVSTDVEESGQWFGA